MTVTEFLSSLGQKLQFISDDDREKIVAFYAAQLALCETQEDLNKKISEIGTPEEIALKVKAVAESQDDTFASEATVVKEDADLTAVAKDNIPSAEKTIVSADQGTLSDTAASEPTVVSSPSDAPTVVSPSSRQEDSGDTILAPFKRTPLPRAERANEWDNLYDDNPVEESTHDAAENADSVEADDEGERVSFKRRKKAKEEQVQSDVLEEEISEKPKKSFKPITGSNLMDTLMKKSGKTPEESVGLFNLLRILFVLPFLAFSLLLVFCYFAAVAVVAAGVIALLLLILLCGLCGVAGLAYGILSFFTQSGVIATIEIGLATILFAVVTALIAICYELIAGIIPILIKKLTTLYVSLIRWFCYKVTGVSSLSELFKLRK